MHEVVRKVKVMGELVVRGELLHSLFIVPKLMSRLVILDTGRSFSMVLYILSCRLLVSSEMNFVLAFLLQGCHASSLRVLKFNMDSDYRLCGHLSRTERLST
jgi:hypothetical protein